MNLYEFTFIAQQGLSSQEIEGMVQELAVLLKNIKVEFTSQEVKNFIDKIARDVAKQTGSISEVDDKLIKQELEKYSKKIQEELVVYSNVLEKIVKVLWTDLQEDLSNLKEIKVHVSKELNGILGEVRATSKDEIIDDVVDIIKNDALECITKISEDALKNIEAKYSKAQLKSIYQSDKVLVKLSENVKASGVIKHEHWGLLDLAYPINKVKSGNYCLLCISSTPKIMDEFIRKVKLNENIIRHLCIQVDKVFEGQSHMISRHTEEQVA